MAKSFRALSDQIMADPARRARVEEHERAIRDALALGELRERRGATQRDVAKSLANSQANVSRIEHQDDVYLSTLREYVAALGGRLEIAAVFPDETIYLTSPADGTGDVSGRLGGVGVDVQQWGIPKQEPSGDGGLQSFTASNGSTRSQTIRLLAKT